MNDTLEKNVDAENFHRLLIKKIGGKAVEGKQIKSYLDAVLPDWKDMTPTNLYKNVHDMLSDAKKNRRFEVEQTWKRTLYSFILLFPLFTFFIYLIIDSGINMRYLYIGYLSDRYGISDVQISIWIVLAFINFFLSLVSLFIYSEGRKQQENWEYHISYLQEILGIRFMRLSLGFKSFKSLEYAHRVILILITAIWFSILYFLAFEALIKYAPSNRDTGWLIAIPVLLSLLIYTIWISLIIFRIFSFSIIIIYSFIKEGRKERNGLNGDVNIHCLKDFDFNLLETTDTNSQSAKSYFSKFMSLVRSVTF